MIGSNIDFGTYYINQSLKIVKEFFGLAEKLTDREDISKSYNLFFTYLLGNVFSWKFLAYSAIHVLKFSLKPICNNLINDELKLCTDSQVDRYVSLHMKIKMAANQIWAVVFSAALVLATLIRVFRNGSINIGIYWLREMVYFVPNLTKERNNQCLLQLGKS